MINIDDTICARILELYSNNCSIAKIATILNLNDYYVTKILKKNNVTIRKINYQKISIDIAKINDLYNSGLSTYEIAKIFNCSDETIRRNICNIRDINIRNRRNQQTIDKIRQKSLELWKDNDYIEKVKSGMSTEQYKIAHSIAAKKNNTLSKWSKSDIGRLTISERSKKLWLSSDYRIKQSKWNWKRRASLAKAIDVLQNDPIKKQLWLNKLQKISSQRINNRYISFSQRQLYYILSTSNIEYHEEGSNTRISPFYVVDCIIPQQQNMMKPLIIEIQGEYWHSLPKTIVKDRQKATYISKYTNYDLLYIDDLQITSFDHIRNILKDYGLTINDIKFDVSQTILKRITERDAKEFYSIFHYSSTIRKGAITYGLYFNDVLVAAISYSYPSRLESTIRLGFKPGEVLEISRMARRINTVCSNLCSFLIGLTRKLLPDNVKCLISFSDFTYGHVGTVYKAAGFINDGDIEPDYHYVSMTGKFHKKTIWDRAKKFKCSESDYAISHGLIKIYGKNKTRWLYYL